MSKLSGKVVLISGATAGIGAAAARLFVEAGAAVVLGGRRREQGEALARSLRDAGGRAVFEVSDVRKHADNEALVARALSEFDRLDAAFNNAGIESTTSLGDITDETYDLVFDTNIRGAFSALRAQLPALTKSRGSVIFSSSTAGTRGFAHASLYTASKHALEGLVKSAALELAPLGIRVNAVMPGPTATEMLSRFTGGHPEAAAAHVPLGRLATPEEVAAVAVWLASDEARFVSGTSILVDGALTAR